MVCNSGLRCPSHNQAVGGSANSLHLPHGSLQQGYAGDFTFANPALRSGINLLRLYVLFESYGRADGNTGLGLYDTFIHVDLRGQLGMSSARWSGEFSWPNL